MANPKNFLINVDLNLNELQNVVIHNLAVDPAGVEGQVIYNTVDACFKVYDGATWQCVRYIDDAGTGTTDLWSATQIQNAINTAVTSGMTYQGGYSASANTPNLDSSPTAGTLFVGDTYTVTTAGNLFGEAVQIGDMIIVEVDDPSSLADFTIVERNLNTATETSEGTVELATQAEVDAGTDTTRAITPVTLSTFVDNSNITSVHCETGVSIGTTPALQTITHNLNTRCVNVTVHDTTTFEEYEVDVVHATLNTVTICANGSTKTVDVTVIG